MAQLFQPKSSGLLNKALAIKQFQFNQEQAIKAQEIQQQGLDLKGQQLDIAQQTVNIAQVKSDEQVKEAEVIQGKKDNFLYLDTLVSDQTPENYPDTFQQFFPSTRTNIFAEWLKDTGFISVQEGSGKQGLSQFDLERAQEVFSKNPELLNSSIKNELNEIGIQNAKTQAMINNPDILKNDKDGAGLNRLKEQLKFGQEYEIKLNESLAKLTKAGTKPAATTLKTPQNYQLANGDIVLSRNGVVDLTGSPLGPGAIKVAGGATQTELQASKARAAASEALVDTDDKDAGISTTDTRGTKVKEAVLEGTGVGSALESLADNVLGGLGLLDFFGQGKAFADVQGSKQLLRLIKQTGKPALINSKRFPIAEQKNVDKLFMDPDAIFRNPESELLKLGVLRNHFIESKTRNNEAILTATPKEIKEIRANNLELDRVLSLLGTEGQSTGDAGIIATTVNMPDGSIQSFDASGKRIQ